jgi:hypothetical protein
LNLAVSGILLVGAVNRIQQIPIAHWLGQEINGAGFHDAHARRNISQRALAGR